MNIFKRLFKKQIIVNIAPSNKKDKFKSGDKVWCSYISKYGEIIGKSYRNDLLYEDYYDKTETRWYYVKLKDGEIIEQNEVYTYSNNEYANMVNRVIANDPTASQSTINALHNRIKEGKNF